MAGYNRPTTSGGASANKNSRYELLREFQNALDAKQAGIRLDRPVVHTSARASAAKSNQKTHLRDSQKATATKGKSAERAKPVHISKSSDESSNEYDSGRKAKKQGESSGKKKNRLLRIFICLSLAAFVCVLAYSAIIFSNYLDMMSSRGEYTPLRELVRELESESIEDEEMIRYISAFDEEMRRINPDYICWIKIEGTAIDYPIVRGSDNEKYLNLSFSGEENRYGTLFMDYRCAGEYVPHIIIYGHNIKQGDMFGGLRRFLNGQYLLEHPVITLIVNDRMVEYEIFDARKTNIGDLAYFLDFSYPGSFSDFAEKCGAPAGAAQIITLSTCLSEGDPNERVIIQGVLR